MANDLTATKATAVDAVRLRDSVNRLYASIERDRWNQDRLPVLPSAVQRRDLTERKQDLRARLRPVSAAPGEQDRARGAIALFLAGYLNARTNDVEATSRAYLAHLMDQPYFAIMQAIDDFRHRRVYDLDKDGERVPFTIDHAPSAFRLLDQVKKRAAEVQEEHYKIVRVLAITKTTEAPSISPEEAERVATGFRELASGMMQRMEQQRAEDRKRVKAEAQAAYERSRRIIQEAAERRLSEQQEQING